MEAMIGAIVVTLIVSTWLVYRVANKLQVCK